MLCSWCNLQKTTGGFNADCYKISLAQWWWSYFFPFVKVFFFFLLDIKINECVHRLLQCLKLAEHHAFSITVLDVCNFLPPRTYIKARTQTQKYFACSSLCIHGTEVRTTNDVKKYKWWLNCQVFLQSKIWMWISEH